MPNESTTRDAFLSRVRAGLGRSSSVTPPPLDVHADDARLVPTGSDLLGLFVSRAAGVGMNVHRTPLGKLTETVRRLPTQRPTVSIEDPALRKLIEENTSGRIDWRAMPSLDALYNADAGITDVAAAIAETGTLVVRSSPLTTRGGFLVPPIHIALVRASQIISDMVDLWRLLQPIPTSVVLITGPSKTADIEGILITGVHGPKEVHIVLIDDA